MPSNTDLERSFYGSNLGLSEAQIANTSMATLQARFFALSFTKTPAVKPSVVVATTTGIINPANAAYTVADQTALAARVQELVARVNEIRTALISAGLIQ